MALTDILSTVQGTRARVTEAANALLAPTRSQDVVAVLNADTYEQVFADARPLEANVDEDSDLMEHPLEDGATIVDHRVMRPTLVALPLRVTSENYRDVYAEIRQLWQDGTLLTVQTRTRTYESMLIERMPHRESADGAESIDINLRLKEARFVTPSFGELPPRKVAAPAATSTKKKGIVKTTRASPAVVAKTVPVVKAAATPQRTSVLYGLTH